VYPRPQAEFRGLVEEINQSAQLALRVGTLLLGGGAPTEDVEAAVFAVGASLGLVDFEVETTYTTIVISVSPSSDHPGLSDMRVIRSRSLHYARVAAAHRLVLGLVDGSVRPDELPELLAEVERLRRPFQKWMVVVASGVLSSAIAVKLGGGSQTALLAFVTASITGILGIRLATRRAPAFFTNIVLALIATLVAVGVSQTDWKVKASLVVVGGIIALLPGMSLVVAAQEAIGSFSVTAAARMVELFVATIGIVVGVLLGLQLADRLDVRLQVTVGTDNGVKELTVAMIAAGVAALAAAVTYQSPRRLAFTVGLVGALGVGLDEAARTIIDSPGAAVVLPAVVIGFVGKLIGARLYVPTILVTVPAIVPLLPGLAVYQGLLSLTQGEPLKGITFLVGAISIAVGLAGGVLLGQLIGGRPSRYLNELPRTRRAR